MSARDMHQLTPLDMREGTLPKSLAAQQYRRCQALWTAVLIDAVRATRGNTRVHSGKLNRENVIRAARDWFLSGNTGAGSFLWVCTMIDANPDYLRKHVFDAGKAVRA